jgi:hypothetical protein
MTHHWEEGIEKESDDTWSLDYLDESRREIALGYAKNNSWLKGSATHLPSSLPLVAYSLSEHHTKLYYDCGSEAVQ